MVFSGGIAAWEQSHMRKRFRSKYFLDYCFNSLSLNHLLCTAPYVIYQWPNVLGKISTTSKFTSNLAVTIEVNKYNEAKNLSAICCTAYIYISSPSFTTDPLHIFNKSSDWINAVVMLHSSRTINECITSCMKKSLLHVSRSS